MTASNKTSNELQRKIRLAANQYQCAQILRCWFLFGAATFINALAFGLAAALCYWMGVSALWPMGLSGAMEIAAAGYFLFYLMGRPVSLDQIALHIEEHHPELESRIISAVSFESGKVEGASPWIIERFFEESDEIARPISFSELMDADVLVNLVLMNGGFVLASVLVIGLFYPFWLSKPRSEAPQTVALVPIADFTVEPGDVRVRIGERQIIIGKTSETDESAVMRWRPTGQEWQVEDMARSLSDHVFHFTFDNIQQSIEYQVVMGRRSSEVYTITAWLPPQVDTINLSYNYPDYLGLDNVSVPNGGAISAIEGTVVSVSAVVNKDLEQAEMVLDTGQRIAMAEAADRVWFVTRTLTHSGSYSIELLDREGNPSEYNPEYDIQVQLDQPPEIKIKFPQQDYEVTLLDETPFEFHVQDDYGLKDFGLQYEIAGQEPERISLLDSSTLLKESQGEYTLYLEELPLEPGDLITWTLWAQDAKGDRDQFEEYGDPYFLEIRPFKKNYREAMSNAGQGQQQQQQQQGQQGDGAEQKDIVIAIWKLRKDASGLSETEINERRAAIIEAQQSLLEKYQEEAGMAGGSPLVIDLLKAMNETIESLEEANPEASDGPLTQAIGSAQRAYHLILKLKPDEAEVQQSQESAMGSGGGGGQQGDRPEIDELELDRRRNFYEEEQQTQQEMEQTNKALNRIKELAQRQQSINEEISKLISELEKEQNSEELKRRLERLQEEERRNLERLDQAERSLANGDMRDAQIDEPEPGKPGAAATARSARSGRSGAQLARPDGRGLARIFPRRGAATNAGTAKPHGAIGAARAKNQTPHGRNTKRSKIAFAFA